MKLELLVLFAALTLPALSSALFFGVTLTNTAGATILALNPTAVAGLAAIGVAGAGLAAATAALLARPPPPPPAPAPAPRPTKGRYYKKNKHYRGRRDSAAQTTVTLDTADQLYDKIFGDLAENKMVGCFQRLVCDIAARPAGFADNVPILEGLGLAEQLELNPTARTVSEQLLKAMQFGADLEDVGHCEGFFSECAWTGEEMDLVIKDMKNRV